MRPEILTLLVPLPPLLAFGLIVLFTNRSNRLSHSVAIGAMLLSYANVQFYQELMGRAREAIAQGGFARFAADVKRRYAAPRDDEDG